MLQAGALQEAAVLRERRLDPALPVMRAHGVPHLVAHLNGDISLAEAARGAKLDTCRYAKRQLTFARHQLASFRWLTAEEAETLALAECSGLNAARK
jgi:tRNA dimethylallyltransferase